MPNHTYSKSEKPYGRRVVELIQALRVMRDSLDGIAHGEIHQFLPLFGLLRSLLAEKSRDAEPLLVAVGKTAGDSLEVFVGPAAGGRDTALEELGLPAPDFELSGFPVSLERLLPNQERVPIGNLLEMPIVRQGGKTFTTRKIIEFYANQFGGAHFSKQVPDELGELLQLRMNGLPVLNSGLQQLGQLVYELGRRVLRRLCDFKLLLFVAVPAQSMESEPFFFHHVYPNSSIEVALRATAMSGLAFSVRSLQGALATVASGPIDWGGEPHWIFVSFHIDDALGSELELILDGAVVARARVGDTMLVANEFSHYQKFMNRSAPDAEAGLHFGFGRQMGLLHVEQPITAATWMTGFEQLRQNPVHWGQCRVFRPGGWAEGPEGDRDIELDELELVDTAAYLARFSRQGASDGVAEGDKDNSEEAL